MESKGRPGLGPTHEESALNMFRQMDLKGKSKDDTQLKTVHQNTVTTIRSYDESSGSIGKFSCEYSLDFQEHHFAHPSQPAALMDEWSYGRHEKGVIYQLWKTTTGTLQNALHRDEKITLVNTNRNR